MDLIIGDRTVREALEQGVHVQELEQEWQQDLEEYRNRIQPVSLYD